VPLWAILWALRLNNFEAFLHRLRFTVGHANHARLDPSRIIVRVGLRRVLGIANRHRRGPVAQPPLDTSQGNPARQRVNRESPPEIVHHRMRPAEPLGDSREQPDGGLSREGTREYGVIRSGQHGLPVLSQRAGQRLAHRYHPPVTLRGLHSLPSYPEGTLREPHILPGEPQRLADSEPCRGEQLKERQPVSDLSGSSHGPQTESGSYFLSIWASTTPSSTSAVAGRTRWRPLIRWRDFTLPCSRPRGDELVVDVLRRTGRGWYLWRGDVAGAWWTPYPIPSESWTTPLLWSGEDWIYVLARSRELWRITARGDRLEQLGALPERCSPWRTALSADARRLVCAVSGTERDVWLAENFDRED
jgi:hypothetical protein